MELPAFENVEEIERHPIDIELIKCQSQIKDLCVNMLSLVGIEISEVTLNTHYGSWDIEYNGVDVFSCNLEELIRSKKDGK